MFLFLQLEETRAFLLDQLSLEPTSATSTDRTSPLTETETDDAALLHMRRGDMHALRGEWEKAAAEYREAADAGGSIAALRKLAQAQLQRRDVHGAQDTLDRLRREGAKPQDLLLLESIIELRTGELTKARALLESAEDSPQKHYGLALLALISGDHETTRQELTEVSGGWEPVLRSYARLLLAAYDEYALFPESPEIHLLTLLSRSLAQVQECELALPLLSRVTREQDDYRDAWIVQGFCELTTERWSEALASLERAYQIDPEKPETQYFLARAYKGLNDHGNAFTFLQYALRNGFQPEAEVRTLLAEEALENGNTSLALEQYDALTQLPDATIDTYGNYISAAVTAGKTQEAAVKAQEAVQKWPDQAEAYDLAGWAALRNNQPEEARMALEKALELDPSLRSARERLEQL